MEEISNELPWKAVAQSQTAANNRCAVRCISAQVQPLCHADSLITYET